jgi:hypothetical protein
MKALSYVKAGVGCGAVRCGQGWGAVRELTG